MISRITLKNFQAHRKLTIDLDPKVTTIVGATDAGKSSILRGVRWLCLNKPSGSGFIRKGKGSCQVSVAVGGKTVRRFRSKSKNLYRIDGKRLKAFGAKVPKPVAKLLNVGDDNFQGQLEGPFWLNLVPGQLSKALNEVVDLSLIDDTVSELSKQARRAQAELDITKERLDDAIRERDSLEYVAEMDADLRRVETAAAEAAEIRGKAADLREALSLARSLRADAKRAADRAEAFRRGERAFSAMESDLTDLRTRADRLRGLINEAVAYRRDRDRAASDLTEAEAELETFEECPVCRQPLTTK